jgi:hypothetical protein
MTLHRLSALAVGAVLIADPAFAHHSYQMFDLSKQVKVEGVIKEFQWANPHAFVEVMVADDAGQLQQWSFETPAPGSLRRKGWRFNSIKPGDKVTLTMSPLKSGSRGGFLQTLTTPGGVTLKTSG